MFTENENSFALSIVGYQFPDAASEPYDSNWLIIHLNVSDSQGSWEVTDPCLLTYEVGYLANWFDKINSLFFQEMECDYLEPVISFHVVEHKQHKYLRLCFTLEALPPWAQSQNEYFIEFTLARLDLKSASQNLRKQLEMYPQRAER